MVEAVLAVEQDEIAATDDEKLLVSGKIERSRTASLSVRR